MNSNARNSGLRRAIFAGGLAATALAAVLAPDWTAVLKAQGYYGNVDLSIAADIPPNPLRPGDEVDVLVLVANNGPDAAQHVRTVATAQNLSFVAASGCNSAASYPQCQLADSLQAGSSADYLLRMRVPQDARNHVQFSASVMSDDTEIQPGDEIVLLKQRIEVPVDLLTDIICEYRQRTERVSRCSFRFSNIGSYGARQPSLQATIAAPTALRVNWRCESNPAGLCAGAQGSGMAYSVQPGLLPAGASVMFFADFSLYAAAPLVTLDANARLNSLMGESELNPANNPTSVVFEAPLFVDGFDRNP